MIPHDVSWLGDDSLIDTFNNSDQDSQATQEHKQEQETELKLWYKHTKPNRNPLSRRWTDWNTIKDPWTG